MVYTDLKLVVDDFSARLEKPALKVSRFPREFAARTLKVGYGKVNLITRTYELSATR